MEDMRRLVENHSRYIEQSIKLHKKLFELVYYNTKITAAYGDNTGGGKGSVSSKVERHALRIKETEEKILVLEAKIYTVNRAEKVLTRKEKEVIDLIKTGYYNNLAQIGRVIGQKKKYVYTVRNRAIKKMSEYISNNI